MNNKNASNKNYYYIFLSVIAIVVVAALWLFVRQYTSRFKTTLGEEIQSYMMEVAQQVTLVMNERVDNNLLYLQSDAMTIEARGEQSTDKIITYLQSEAERFGYTQMSLVNVNGISVNSLGKTYNVSNRPHYLAALKGEPAVSGVISAGANNADCIEYAVPITNGEEIVGVLMASYTLDRFRDIFHVNMFEQQGNAMVIDSQGIVVVDNDVTQAYNFFHTLKKDKSVLDVERDRFAADVLAGVSGCLTYNQRDTDFMMYYQPLGINNWSVLISIPSDVVTNKTEILLQGLAYISGGIALLIATLMMILVYMQYRNRLRLEQILFVDPITCGATQARFEIDAAKLIVTKENGSYALVQMNLQKFKLINTTFGREVGDRTLRYIYDVICSELKADELTARLSADKFGMLLRYYSKDEFATRLAVISSKINSFNDDKKNKYILQFEQGVCLINDIAEKPDVYFERANFARRHGDKLQIGQSAISFYVDVERDIVMREQQIENNMEQALKDGEFEMYLQPKYELVNNTIGGAEALVRWASPEKGMIFPDNFIPLFERNGFIVEVDLYMFEQVCKLQQLWKDTGTKPVPISVNLSRVHLNNPDFLERYKNIFKQYDFKAELIEIELTESTVFGDVEELCCVIDKTKEIGFTCSLDDFGSGYSSLNLLKDIPVDTLKLDRAFFYSKNADETKSRYVVENMVDLARKLSMHTVSEGIETMEMVDYLRSVKCDMVQGYVFAKPMPVAQFEVLLESDRNK